MPRPVCSRLHQSLPHGAAFAALDDFTLATPSLEDVYLALGGAVRQGLVKA